MGISSREENPPREVLSLAVIRLLSVDVNAVFHELRQTTGLFRIWKETGDDISAQCPFHAGGQEKNPSFGICNNKLNPNYGTYHCFTCGARGSILTLINQLHNRQDNDNFAVEYAQMFSDLEVEDQHQRIEVKPRTQVVEKETVPEQELSYYRDQACDYLTGRRIKPIIQKAFDCGYDPATSSVTFPVKDIKGDTLFCVRRAVNLKWYNYPAGVKKPLYGIYELSRLAPRSSSVVIVESIINALTLWGQQIPAIALLGTGSNVQIDALNTMGIRNWVLALDGDNAGLNATNKLKRRLLSRTTVMPIPPGKDVNDLDACSINILYSLRR